jgi:hypothetical protein
MSNIMIADGMVRSDSISVPVADIRQVSWRRNAFGKFLKIPSFILGVFAIFALIGSCQLSAQHNPEAGVAIVGGFIILGISGICGWLNSRFCISLIIKTDQQTYEVKTTEKEAIRAQEAISHALR